MGKKELQRYSLRKSSLGAASVLLGTAVLAVGGSNASADEVATTTRSEERRVGKSVQIQQHQQLKQQMLLKKALLP